MTFFPLMAATNKINGDQCPHFENNHGAQNKNNKQTAKSTVSLATYHFVSAETLEGFERAFLDVGLLLVRLNLVKEEQQRLQHHLRDTRQAEH